MRKFLAGLVLFCGLFVVAHGAHAQCNYTAASTDNNTAECATTAWVHNFLGAVTTKCPSVAGQTATFSNGSANIVLATNAITIGCPVNFTTSGSLPTNFATATNYYVVSLATLTITVAAAPGGSAIVAGSAGSGTQTAVGTGMLPTSASSKDVFGIALPVAGTWVCPYEITATETSTVTLLKRGISTSSNTLPTIGAGGGLYESAASFTSAGTESTTGTAVYVTGGAAELYAEIDDTYSGSPTVLGNITCSRVN